MALRACRWGFLSRAGLHDKSQLIRMVEKHADVYTSRVSNFARYTPYQYFRSPSQSLAHDRNLTAYYREMAAAAAEAEAARQDGGAEPAPRGSRGGGGSGGNGSSGYGRAQRPQQHQQRMRR